MRITKLVFSISGQSAAENIYPKPMAARKTVRPGENCSRSALSVNEKNNSVNALLKRIRPINFTGKAKNPLLNSKIAFCLKPILKLEDILSGKRRYKPARYRMDRLKVSNRAISFSMIALKPRCKKLFL